MAKNFVQPGNVITFASAPYALTSGQGALVAELFGVALENSVIATPVTVALSGVFDVTKQAALVVAQGDALYWDDAARELDTTNTNVPVGFATAAALAGDATVRIMLNNSSP